MASRLLIHNMGKIDLPDGGEYRVENEGENKVRIFYNEKVDNFRLQDRVIKVPAEIQSLTQEGLTTLVNTMIHDDKVVACPFCEEVTSLSEMRRHSFAGSVCQTCWTSCVCRQCEKDDWQYTSNRSTRKSNKKKCPHCGQRFVTKVATG